MNVLQPENWKNAAAQVYFLACAAWFASVVARTTALRFHRVLLVVVVSYAVLVVVGGVWRRLRGE